MLETPRGLRVIVILAITLCIVASLTGARAVQGNVGLKIALIDLNRIREDSKEAKKLRAEVEKRRDKFLNEARAISGYPLFEEKEQDEIAAITQVENTPGGQLTDAQKNRQKQLKDQHNALIQEYDNLKALPQGNINVQQRQRFETLAKREAEAQLRLQQRQKQAEEEVNNLLKQVDAKMMKDFKEALNKVAKDKNLNLVFDNQLVLYADQDITDEVLKVLNK